MSEAESGKFDHGGSSLRDAWDEQADAWIRWARTPGHDDYYEMYNRPNFLALLPSPGGRTLDLGCGEGRMARELRALGHHVVGIEPSPALGAAAHDADGLPVARADGVAVPVRDAAVDLVVCFMVLQDVDDLDAVCAEIARVLTPDGVACTAIVHPMVSAGFLDPAEPVLYVGRYLEIMRSHFSVDRNDVPFTFHSAHRPLERYSRAFEAAGLLIEAFREPALPAELVDVDPRLDRHRLIPNFCYFRLRKAVR